jgi:hypothetical protein
MAIEQNGYVGPAPVSLEDYRTQVARQRISNERLTRSMVAAAFGDLVVSPDLLSNVGIAANASRPMLLYGPSGNGKTSIGLRVGALFRDVIFIPYCFEVDGQIIKVYDPAVHKRVERQTSGEKEPISLRRENLDERWVACRRPLVILGGELTLDMLKLGSEACGLYEAPPQVKALGGVLMMDDFGRQIVSPTALLNRWIVPLEAQVDYLTLGTGKTFDLPFDELVIFCTNLTPSDLVDPAFLRRIPYKIEVPAPSADEYRRIFQAVCVSRGIQIDDDMVGELIDEISVKNNFPLAGYQPKSIIDQVFAIAKFEGEEPDISREQIRRALRNLYTTEMAEVLGGKRVTAH